MVRSESCRRRKMKMTRSAATLGPVAQDASPSLRFRTSTQQTSMTIKPTLGRIAITRSSGVKRAASSRGVGQKHGARAERLRRAKLQRLALLDVLEQRFPLAQDDRRYE